MQTTYFEDALARVAAVSVPLHTSTVIIRQRFTIRHFDPATAPTTKDQKRRRLELARLVPIVPYERLVLEFKRVETPWKQHMYRHALVQGPPHGLFDLTRVLHRDSETREVLYNLQ